MQDTHSLERHAPLGQALQDASLSDWLRGALATALRRDPSHAAHDARRLAALLDEHLETLGRAPSTPTARDFDDFAETVRLAL